MLSGRQSQMRLGMHRGELLAGAGRLQFGLPPRLRSSPATMMPRYSSLHENSFEAR